MQNNQLLNEGLRPLDLKEMISPHFDIDTYKSKMGEDQDVCVLTFKAKERFAAKDLMEFIEKGFNFVLDSDISSGENDQGEYFIFVELERSNKLSNQIKEITDSVNKLTGINEWTFKYHKKPEVLPVTEESLSNIIPRSASEYESFVSRIKTESIKKFFTKTLMDDLTLSDNIITIHKPFNQQIKLKLLSDDTKEILESSPSMATEDVAEIFWMTKVLGDYEITKFGNKFLFTNGAETLFLQRIE